MINRCSWCGEDPLYVDYHDKEWGVPLFDDTELFECLCLEGAQAGLSWIRYSGSGRATEWPLIISTIRRSRNIQIKSWLS